jgi:hypothetical protein
MYALLLFTSNNTNLFKNNNELHEYKTRLHENLHLPAVNLAKFDKGAQLRGTKASYDKKQRRASNPH